MTQTNLKKLFAESGLEEVRPTDEALSKMGITRRRFTMLLENSHSTDLTVQELEAIKAWVEQIKNLDSDRLIH